MHIYFLFADKFSTTDEIHVYNRIFENLSVLYIDNGHSPQFVLIQVPQKRDVFCYLDVSVRYYIFIVIFYSSVYEFPWRRTDRDGKSLRRENRDESKRHERSLRVIVACLGSLSELRIYAVSARSSSISSFFKQKRFHKIVIVYLGLSYRVEGRVKCI